MRIIKFKKENNNLNIMSNNRDRNLTNYEKGSIIWMI